MDYITRQQTTQTSVGATKDSGVYARDNVEYIDNVSMERKEGRMDYILHWMISIGFTT
uniref:Uncharacterized protein n=1 Tax=Arion vulgaris TaxID=1028688 RepID=A0A0B7ACE8_9EUPU